MSAARDRKGALALALPSVAVGAGTWYTLPAGTLSTHPLPLVVVGGVIGVVSVLLGVGLVAASCWAWDTLRPLLSRDPARGRRARFERAQQRAERRLQRLASRTHTARAAHAPRPATTANTEPSASAGAWTTPDPAPIGQARGLGAQALRATDTELVSRMDAYLRHTGYGADLVITGLGNDVGVEGGTWTPTASGMRGSCRVVAPTFRAALARFLANPGR